MITSLKEGLGNKLADGCMQGHEKKKFHLLLAFCKYQISRH